MRVPLEYPASSGDAINCGPVMSSFGLVDAKWE